jgi:signal transduction histidine kinase/ligand-binding sensor domain-containing protein
MLLRILLFLVPLSCVCQPQARFGHFSILDGLSQNTVNFTLKDRQGYYWFGTQDGLNRYDGYNVKVFRHDRNDPASLSDNFVLCMLEDGSGNFWVGTRNGVNFLDSRSGKFSRISISEKEKSYYHNSTWAIVKDQEGNILFSNVYSQLIRIDAEDAKEAPFHPAVISEGTLLMATSDSTWCIKEQENKMLSGYSSTSSGVKWKIHDPGVTTGNLLLDDADAILCGTDSGLVKLEKNGKAPFTVFLPGKRINCLLKDSRNKTWIGTPAGLYCRDGKDKLFRHSDEDAHSLSDNSIESIYEDSDGLLWIGTAEGGLNIYDPHMERFRVFTSASPVQLPGKAVWSVFQEGNELWVGTNNGTGHFTLAGKRIAAEENDVKQSETLLSGSFVTAICKDKLGRLWFGSHEGIAVFDPLKKTWQHINKSNSELRSDMIFHLMCASDGRIWISTINGFYCYDPAGGRMNAFLPKNNFNGIFPAGYIFSTCEDRDGTIWAGSTEGIYHIKNTGEKIQFYFSEEANPSSLSYNMGTSFLRDSKGRFWVSTLGGGIDLLDDKTGTFRSYMKKDGLANDIAYRIMEDKNGMLWISTNSGLSCFDPSKEIFTNYAEKDGLPANEFTQNAAFINESGELFFGSPEGMVAFDPGKLAQEQLQIPVQLSSLKINYEEKEFSGNRLDLYYNDKTVSFEFTAPYFRGQEKLNYAFQLEGFDNGWHEVGASGRIVSYSSLPSGDYTFRVRVRLGKGAWLGNELRIPVHVIPPFWLRAWFIAAELILLVLLVFLVVRYYSGRKLRKHLREIEMQQKIYQERERISRDLHDNVGSHLTYITASLDNISYKIDKEQSASSKEKISSLSDFTRSTMQQLRETIWAINKDSVSLEELRDKISDHCSKMTEAGNMRFGMEFDVKEDRLLKPSAAINIYRIVQEAINNAVKHSRADLLLVKISGINDKLNILVRDNGKGMNQSGTNGYGLKNMDDRVKDLGGSIRFGSENGKGTDIEITVPVE